MTSPAAASCPFPSAAAPSQDLQDHGHRGASRAAEPAAGVNLVRSIGTAARVVWRAAELPAGVILDDQPGRRVVSAPRTCRTTGTAGRHVLPSRPWASTWCGRSVPRPRRVACAELPAGVILDDQPGPCRGSFRQGAHARVGHGLAFALTRAAR